MRREQDSVNPDFHADIMLPDFQSTESTAFSYARVIGIYHAQVQLAGQTHFQSFDFLHVRWYHPAQSLPQQWRLPCIRFLSDQDPQAPELAFGFVDPALVIRSVHIMPAFAHGVETLLHTPSLALPESSREDPEYICHYVGM